MIAFLSSPASIRLFGTASSLLILLACIVTAIPYRGTRGERYSPFNHYISELGEVGVSRLAILFNLSLVVGGLLFLPYSLGLGFLLPGTWAKFALMAGLVASIALSLVGIFPMNRLTAHSRAAMTFFRAGLVMMLLFTIAIFAQPPGAEVLPKIVNLAGGAAFLAYAAFLVYSNLKARESDEIFDPQSPKPRPTIWLVPTLEWAVFVTTILWFFFIAASLL